MLFQSYRPLSDAPPGYWRHLVAARRQNALLMLLGLAGVAIARWKDSPRLELLAALVWGLGLLQLALGCSVVLWSSLRSGGGRHPGSHVP